MKKIIKFSWLTAISFSSVGIVSADAGDFVGCPMGGMMYGSYGSGMMLLGWILYLFIIVLIGAAIYWLIKTANKKK